MIYLIGGSPRVGKTTLVKYLVRQRSMHAISTDAIRYMLRRTLPSEVINPDIFIHFKTDILNLWDKDHRATLEEQNQQSRALWPYVTEFIHAYEEDGVDLIIEGVAVLPEFVQNLDVNSRSIFLGNTSPKHAETILRRARNDEHDWMRVLPDEKIS